jgi:NAD(P)-dependent dehydrogenase (short-subunit alcohol dehydrogenase family)
MIRYALILGCSSGIGAATARKLAADGLGIIGVHFDRKANMPQVDSLRRELEELRPGAVHFINQNAARDEVIDEIAAERIPALVGDQPLACVLHSIAFGSTSPLRGSARATRPQLEMTFDVMGANLYYWFTRLFDRGLVRRGTRVLFLTSEGNELALPGYGPVAMAKVAGEALVRQLAAEYGDTGTTFNTIQAGITLTPALQKIPGWEQWVEYTRARNPSRRMTRPDDIANVVSLLCRPEAEFINGALIRVDGGERVTFPAGRS